MAAKLVAFCSNGGRPGVDDESTMKGEDIGHREHWTRRLRSSPLGPGPTTVFVGGYNTNPLAG
jgi:hypothetical protein